MAPNIVEKIADALHIPSVHKHEDTAAATAGGETKKPIFEKEKVTVIFVLGGPGAGVSVSVQPPYTLRVNSSSSSITYLV
jgi:hypothetical protein